MRNGPFLDNWEQLADYWENLRATVINPTSLYGNVYANYLREIAQKIRALKAALKPTDGFVRIVDSRSV
jgi:hypothetical protein